MRMTKIFCLFVVTAFFLQPAGIWAQKVPAQVTAVSKSTIASLEPLADSTFDYFKARHLLFRAGFGGPPEEVEKLLAMGLRKAVDHLVDYRGQPDVHIPLPESVVKKGTDAAEFAKAPHEERLKHLIAFDKKLVVKNILEVRGWWIRRMVSSPRPMEEKLVLFWHGLLAAEHRTVRDSRAMFMQNWLFREHAAGNYGKLLNGLIRDAAMLRYLDNDANVKGKPNENLAREIMELFSMGEGQGYTEQDIKEAARALTGYTYNKQTLVPRFALFQHDTDKKTIFGETGKWNGEDLVKLILKQPATAKFIAKRLFEYFVYENPEPQVVEQLAKVLRDSNYALAALLKTMFLSQEFYGPRSMGTQIKSPAQFVAGTVRTLKINNPPVFALNHAMLLMNQELLDPPNVKGWDGGESWLSTTALFARNNFAGTLVSQGTKPVFKQPKAGKQIKFGKGPQALANGADFVAVMQERKLETSAAVVEHFTKALLLAPLQETRRKELLGFLGELPPADRWVSQKTELNRRISELLVLIMTLPEYQLT